MTTGIYQWQNFFGNFPSDGTTPLNQNTLNLFTIPVGSSIRRTLFHAQLSCQIESSVPSSAPVDFPTRVVAGAGLWLGDTALPAANSPSVLDEANVAEWLFWDTLQERVDFNDLLNAQLCRVVWETPAAGLDLQTRRLAVAGNSNDLWLGWQIDDPNDVINSSESTYNAYLSGWYSVRFLIHTP